jgi:polar amino acid transport system substrate-binding protein
MVTNVPVFASSPARLALAAAMVSITLGGVAFAQEPPKTEPRTGYEDPEGIPVRPPVIDIEPVWAKPAVDTVATIRQRGRLKVGVVENLPFVMRNATGDLVGFSIDLGRQLANDLGVDVEFVPTSWSQLIPDLLGRNFDVIATGLWLTPTRALVVNFSNPTSLGATYLVASKSLASAMKSPRDFDRADVRIVVYAGTGQEVVANRLFPHATLVKLEGDADALAPLLEGKAHALLVTTPTPKLIVDRAPDRLFLPFEDALQSTTTAMAIRKGDADFLNFLNSWLAFQAEDGWLKERQHYWFGGSDWMKGS